MSNAAADQDQLDEMWADDEEGGPQTEKYLFFNLGEELYGVNIMNVTEIIELQRIIEVPDLPEYMRGVINLRGKVIPVMDLRSRFGMELRPYDDRTCIIVTRIDSAALGMIVDTVAEVHDVPEQNIESAQTFAVSANDHYVEGVARVEDRVTILIDTQKILHARDLQAVKAGV